MKNIITKISLLFLFSTILCTAGMAGKKAKPDAAEPPDTHSLVASVSAGASAGTGVIAINGDAAFAVSANTTIIVNGKPATLKDVQAGMAVLSRTTADSSAPEIDLKTVPAAPTTPKKNKKTPAQ